MAEEKKQTEKADVPEKNDDAKSGQVKISHMNLAELEQTLEKTRKQMGGLSSRYGRALLARKAVLTQAKSGN